MSWAPLRSTTTVSSVGAMLKRAGTKVRPAATDMTEAVVLGRLKSQFARTRFDSLPRRSAITNHGTAAGQGLIDVSPWVISQPVLRRMNANANHPAAASAAAAARRLSSAILPATSARREPTLMKRHRIPTDTSKPTSGIDKATAKPPTSSRVWSIETAGSRPAFSAIAMAYANAINQPRSPQELRAVLATWRPMQLTRHDCSLGVHTSETPRWRWSRP